MSVDLSSNASPYEFENMLPLDVLAAVASQTLKNEINSSDLRTEKPFSESKRQSKKAYNFSEVMTLDDIKALPVKLLVDKFSDITADELTKKYCYKCVLLPEICTVAYKSFGNEQKACEKMRSHLLCHLQELSMESDGFTESKRCHSDGKSLVFRSKYAQKIFPKKNGKHMKKQQFSLSHVLPRNTGSRKISKSVKKSSFPMKKIKMKSVKYVKQHEGIKCMDKESKHLSNSDLTSPRRNWWSQIVNCHFENLKDSSLEQNESVSSTENILHSLHDKNSSFETDITEEYDSDCKSTATSLSSNVDSFDKNNDTIFKPEGVEDNCKSQVNSADVDMFLKISDEKGQFFFHDHTYATLNGVKNEKSLPFENKKYTAESLKDVILASKNNFIQSQFIIRTPPFPFVHIPLLPDVAEIQEINTVDDFASENTEQLSNEQLECFCDVDEVELTSDNVIREDLMDYDDKLSNLLHKNDDVTGSVLECVENIVTTKQSNMYSSKSTFSSSNNNVEDLENVQKIEKEFALKCIAKLHSKKKKQIHDSLICQICKDKHFTAQATLIHHYRSHAGIKPYVCKICESTFTRQHSLNYHMLIHQNLSRFTCEFCERTFRHPSHYKEHLRRHTGETPYHCTDCNLHFKTRNTFKRHLKTRHGKLLTAHGVEDLTAEEFSKFRTNPRNKKH